jgi:hypothetical protein
MDSNVIRYDAMTIELCGNPFGPSFDEPIPIAGLHSTAGLPLQFDPDRGCCQLTSMQTGTPAHRIHTWKSRLRHTFILRIDGKDVTSIIGITHDIRDARLLLAPNSVATFTFGEIVNTLNHAGLPQLYFDQMRDIQGHLNNIQRPTINQVIASSPCLTRRKLKQTPEWPEWLAAEHVQLDNYHAQDMFGTPNIPPPNSAVFYWVWVYSVKVHENNRKKAPAVCDGSTRGGTAHVSGHTFAPTPDMIELCMEIALCATTWLHFISCRCLQRFC